VEGDLIGNRTELALDTIDGLVVIRTADVERIELPQL
jgi:hypothetical protein